MITKSIFTVIIFGVFFVGLGVGFGVFTGMTSNNFVTNDSQIITDDSQLKETILNQSLEHTENQNSLIESTMQDPKHVSDMINIMNKNHDFSMDLIYAMIKDPNLQLQLLGHMAENQNMMKQMKKIVDSTNKQSMTNQNTTSSKMLNQEMMIQLMQNPETREKTIQLISNHVDEVQNLLSFELEQSEFDKNMVELMKNHMDEMQHLMAENSIQHTMK
tara:strand:- start:1590 stop:2240 length:651 start_codon:yes stop_codon:yes gene_type:complete